MWAKLGELLKRVLLSLLVNGGLTSAVSSPCVEGKLSLLNWQALHRRAYKLGKSKVFLEFHRELLSFLHQQAIREVALRESTELSLPLELSLSVDSSQRSQGIVQIVNLAFKPFGFLN